MYHFKINKHKGFTLIELLVVIAIIGILATLIMVVAGNSRDKAQDTRIRNSVRQVRWLAEIAYDSQGGSFISWSLYPDIQNELTTLNNEIDDAYGGTNVATIRDYDIQDYCVSAPLKSEAGKHYCIDSNAVFMIVSNPCPELGIFPLKCSSP